MNQFSKAVSILRINYQEFILPSRIKNKSFFHKLRFRNADNETYFLFNCLRILILHNFKPIYLRYLTF